MSGPPGLSGERLCAGADVGGAVARAGTAGYSLEAYRKTRERIVNMNALRHRPPPS